MKPKIIDYDAQESVGTGSHIAADELIKKRNALQDMQGDGTQDVSLGNAYAEGFSSASGVRGETAETGGRIRHPESKDNSRTKGLPTAAEEENSGLADN